MVLNEEPGWRSPGGEVELALPVATEEAMARLAGAQVGRDDRLAGRPVTGVA